MKHRFLLFAFIPSCLFAHMHHENESQGVLSPATTQSFPNKVIIQSQGGYRLIASNGIPDHPTGQFPNRGNPNAIQEQVYHFRMTETPTKAPHITLSRPHSFGVVLNGVPLDPGTAEFWNRDPRSGWVYEALYKAGLLGMDQSPGHVQPNGAYHYHGLPILFLKNKKGYGTEMTLIGYAADGFPIYSPYCPSDAKNIASPIRLMKSSYRVKSGQRPGGPGGNYTGEFTEDFEYVPGKGDLDECNGREGVTTR